MAAFTYFSRVSFGSFGIADSSLAGRSESALVNLISKPGMAIQKLTTQEPDDSMIEVAIQAVEAVFDWRAYEAENFGTETDL